MPFIDFRTNADLTHEQETTLKQSFGSAIGVIPGKAESGLMVQVSDKCHLWFGGDEEKTIAFVNVMVYGSAAPEHYRNFGDAVIPEIEKVLGDCKVYLKVEETTNWCWN